MHTPYTLYIALELLLKNSPSTWRLRVCCILRWLVLYREKGHPEALTTTESALTWYQALKVVSRRQWTLALRDRALVIGR